jgi:HPt (histidine-containing phosphotransfer) domain-containing protein
MASILNIDENSAAIKISRQIYVRILGKAIEQSEKDLQELEQAFSKDQFEIVQTISHRLKGDYGNLRIAAFSEIARQINEVSKTTKDRNQTGQLVNALKEQFEELKTAFKETTIKT